MKQNYKNFEQLIQLSSCSIDKFDNVINCFSFFQLSSDGNTTTSTVSLQLTKADAGAKLACRASNPQMPSLAALEDDWLLDIQCKCARSFLYKLVRLIHFLKTYKYIYFLEFDITFHIISILHNNQCCYLTSK